MGERPFSEAPPLAMPTESQVLEYLRHLENECGLSKRTVEGRRYELLRLVESGVKLEAEALAEFVSRGRSGQALSPANRNHRLVVVRGFVRFLVDRGELMVDPTEKLKRARVPRSIKVALRHTDLRQALDALGKQPVGWRRARDEAMICLCYYTGLRVSEMQCLVLSQLDLDRGLIRGARRKGGGTTDVVLNSEAVGVMRRWQESRSTFAGEALFARTGGEALSVRQIQKRFRRLGVEASLPLPLHPHGVRRTHGTELLSASGDIEATRLSLNHESIETTQLYISSDRAALRQALEQLPPLSITGSS